MEFHIGWTGFLHYYVHSTCCQDRHNGQYNIGIPNHYIVCKLQTCSKRYELDMPKNKKARLFRRAFRSRGGQIRTDDLGAQAPRDTGYTMEIFRSWRNLPAPRFLILFSSFIASPLVSHTRLKTIFHGIPYRMDRVSPLLCSFNLLSRSAQWPI